MPNTREMELWQLVNKAFQKSIEKFGDIFAKDVTRDLLDNGVTIPVRCGECDWYREDGSICVNPKCTKSFYGCPVPPDHFCSYGERRNDG